jgi:hypothetical protein
VAISGVQTQFSSMLHVDDASLINHALHPDEPVSQVILWTQSCTNTWQGVLQALGGDLHAMKCAWTLIDFIWIDSQWRYWSVGAMPATLKVNWKRWTAKEWFEHLALRKRSMPTNLNSKACMQQSLPSAPSPYITKLHQGKSWCAATTRILYGYLAFRWPKSHYVPRMWTCYTLSTRLLPTCPSKWFFKTSRDT